LPRVSVLLGLYGLYRLTTSSILARTESKRRRHDVRNVLRLCFGAVTLVIVFGITTRNWVSVLFSLGVLGFAITFALQQPLFSLIGWV
jgi:small-conductance mechanosensitive channel